jgi:FkbM family methyltransferase
MIRSVVSPLSKLTNWLGFRVTRSTRLATLDDFFFRLKPLPINVSIIYDIGAHSGEYAKTIKEHFPNSKVVLFEANESHRKVLSQTGFDFFIVTLFRENVTIPFYSVGGTGDSLYRENNFSAYIEQDPIEVQARKLDDFISQYDLPLPDFIKIDVQGAELDVLMGGTTSINYAKIITLELAICNYNSGAPNFSQSVEFMINKGFIPFDVVEYHQMHGSLVQIDLAFMRKDIMIECFGNIPRRFLPSFG